MCQNDTECNQPKIVSAVNPEQFNCSQCSSPGTAPEMFAKDCDLLYMTRETLRDVVICRKCSEQIAADNHRQLDKPGSGVIPLARTLRKLRELSKLTQAQRDQILAAEEANAVNRANAESMRKQEEFFRRSKKISEYVQRYAAGAPETPDKVTLPPVRRLNKDGELTCGLPLTVPCCRHNRPAERFMAINGELIGLCKLASGIFASERRELDFKDPSFNRLKTTSDLETAEYHAAKQRGENPDGEDDLSDDDSDAVDDSE